MSHQALSAFLRPGTPFFSILYETWPHADGSIRLVFLSEGAEDLLEATAEEITHQLQTRSLPLVDTDENEFYTRLEESTRNHAAWTSEFSYRAPRSGKIHWLWGQDFPRYTPDGTPYFSGVLVDITAVKETDERSRRADRILSQHIANTTLAVIEWGEEFRLTRWSGQAEAIFGWTAEEVLGKMPHEWRFVHEADAARVTEVIQELTSQVKPRNVSINRNYHKSGRVLICEWHNSIVFDEHGKATSVLSLTQDLTEMQTAQAELARSQERLLTAMRFANTLAWDYDLRTGKSYFSQPQGGFYGLDEPCDSIEDVQALRVIHTEDRECIRSVFVDDINSPPDNEIQELRIEFRSAAVDAMNRPRWFLLQASLLREDDTPTRIVGLSTEISQRKRDEEERRAVDLQLLETRRYESLGVLAGGVAHDFNNLLTVVLGNAAIVRSNCQPGDALYANLQSIETAGQRAADLCRQLTAYAGTGLLFLRPLDLSALVLESGPALVTVSRSANITFHLAVDPPLVNIEPFQCRQLLLNLVANAAESYPALDGSGTIRIETSTLTLTADDRLAYSPAPSPGEYVVLRVVDRGCGIPEAVLAKIYDPFYSTKFTGRGLGLAAVLGIARGHKGGVRITSEVNRGTTVEVLFPVHREETGEPSPEIIQVTDTTSEKIAQTATNAPRIGDGRNVLVVDDEANIRELIGSVLEEECFRVVSAANGLAALTELQDGNLPICLVIVDMIMPGVSGTEVIRRLREQRPGLPAVLATGYIDRELATGLSKSGRIVLLTKPFRIEQLLAAVIEALAVE